MCSTTLSVYCAARCIDTYTSQRQKAAQTESGEHDEIDGRLLSIVERLFQKCVVDGQYEQAVGLGIEAHRLDFLEEAIMKSPEPSKSVEYTLKSIQRSISSKNYRDEILQLIVDIYERLSNPDLGAVMKCLMILHQVDKAADILIKLLRGNEDKVLMAYQISFDVFGAEKQEFTTALRQRLAQEFKIVELEDKPEENPSTEKQQENDAMDADGIGGESAGLETPLLTGADNEEVVEIAPQDRAASRTDRILSGAIPMELERQFLARNNATDFQILKNIKSSVEPRNSVCHGATVFANALMNAGTTNDSFLRENLDWLAKATNWSKFSATAGLGVIHKGNIKNSKSVMSPYLPSNPSSNSSPYSQGGALYAMGLIHSNNEAGARAYLLEALKSTNNEVVQHGACLGLGVAALGSGDESLFTDIRELVYSDGAIAGEAAGFAMGMIFAGVGKGKTEDFLAQSGETEHEKIIRGLALGAAIVEYGQEEKADSAIEAMILDQDPILRYGGMFAIGLAYCGTCDNAAMQKLLHFAVSDVSNDVRRSAVMSIGFVLAGYPELCVRTVSLLSESYNPHVRYGSAMAIGISGAGTGCRESVALLEPMLKDATDFVQQGALISLALLLVEQPESRQQILRDRINEVHGSRAVELMTRMGAIMAAGILDVAGRNATISLHTDIGGLRKCAVIGLAVFLQYWYWYPLTHMISLAIKPTALICVDDTLAPPKNFKAKCNCKKSLFAYPASVAVEDKKFREKLTTAVLSTTARAKARAAKKDADQKAQDKADTMAVEKEDSKEDQLKEPQEEEAATHELDNPARVVNAQRKFVEFLEDSRWKPVRSQPSGFVVLKDSFPEKQTVYAFDDLEGNKDAEKQEEGGPSRQGEEPPPPQPFEYVPS